MPNRLNLNAVTKRYLVKQAQSDLPARKLRQNKSHGGRCLVVAGSPGQWGAGILCAQAAARSGAGYTFIYDSKTKFPIVQHPDFLVVRSLKNLSQFNAVAIGPGFHNPRMIRTLILKLMKRPAIQVVLDAEALNTLSAMKKKLKLPPHWILTPHEGELSRLIRIPSQQIKKDRLKSVRIAQKMWGAVVVLKGYKTLIADAQTVWEIPTGNPALSKAGTGDVLTGMIAALLSQGLYPRKAACLAAFAHGLCADRWIASGKDPLSLLATDVIDGLPETFSQIRKS